MIRIAVIDYSAEARSRILEQLDTFLRSDIPEIQLAPRISLKPLSIQEINFHSAPDVCLIGPELINKEMTEISRIKKLFPNTPILVWLDQQLSNLNVIEQIARQGADDFLSFDTSAQYFFKRLLILSRKTIRQSSGKLIVVDGGKGGVGVTTVVAALAELVSSKAQKVVIVDCDFETQDCSRFLQCRPFINENLRLILDEERAISEESVDQCLSLVWQDDKFLRCMAAVADNDDLYNPKSNATRIFMSVLEILDSSNDLVVIDIGCARSNLQKMLYRVADKLIFVINDDPASFYASVEKLTRARSQLSAGAQLCVLENNVGLSGLGNRLLRKEFSRAAKIVDSQWSPEPISFCKVGQRWPGSGATFYTQAKSASTKAFDKLSRFLTLSVETDSRSGFRQLFRKTDAAERSHSSTSVQSAKAIPLKANSETPLVLIEDETTQKEEEFFVGKEREVYGLDQLVSAAKLR